MVRGCPKASGASGYIIVAWIVSISVLALQVFIAPPVLAQGVISLPQTGQTKCYDTTGAEVDCAGTGQDGETRAGAPWPEVRFLPGTGDEAECMVDNLTGLMWTKNGNLTGATTMKWHDAVDYANQVTFCGYSDWRLPNVNELESLVHPGERDTYLWLIAEGFTNVQPNWYWSSTAYVQYSSSFHEWIVNMWDGEVRNGWTGASYYVWPVRGGIIPSSEVLSVSKSGTGSGTITSSQPGIDCGTDCSAGFTRGTVLTLHATPTAHSTFSGWSGGGCSGTGTCTVTMDDDVSVTATFTMQYTLQVVAGQCPVFSIPSGINCVAPSSCEFTEGTVVSLWGGPPAYDGVRYHFFTGWSGGGCSGTGTCTVTMNAATTVNAECSVYDPMCKQNCQLSHMCSDCAYYCGIPGRSGCQECLTSCQTALDACLSNCEPCPPQVCPAGPEAVDGTATVISTAKDGGPDRRMAASVPVLGRSRKPTSTVGVEEALDSSVLWRTGQTVAFREGDDGNLQAGAVWPSPRFVDNGDRTVTDKLTGLMWTRNANSPGPTACSPGMAKNWQGALEQVKCTNAHAYLDYTDWRLPNRKEFLSLLDRSRFDPALPQDSPFQDVQSNWYWSSTSYGLYNTYEAWVMNMWDGYLGHEDKEDNYYYVWPVRSLQSDPAQLLVSKSGNGSGTVTSSPSGIDCGIDCSESYDEGSQVTLTATPASGSLFAGWLGGGCSGTGACVVTMNQAKTVSAGFTRTAMDATGPSLTIKSPKNGQSAMAATVTVSGTATDARKGGGGIVSVLVNGERASSDTAAGSGVASWSKTIALNTGTNTITVVAADGFGNTTTKSITMTRLVVVGDWLWDISGPTPYGGSVDGVAVITIDEDGSFTGYGGVLSRDQSYGYPISLTGNLNAVDSKGNISGSIRITDSDTGVALLPFTTLAGALDKKFTKMTLKFGTGPGATGIPMPSDTKYPSTWVVAGKGPGVKATLSITIAQDPDYQHRVYRSSGEGLLVDNKGHASVAIVVEGLFLVNSKGKVYGQYRVNGGQEEGYFWGSISSKAFSFSLLSSEGYRSTMKGRPME